jgi:hypothetical protein
MEAIAAHALRCEVPWQRKFLRQRRFASMKGSIEASNLWNSGCNSGDCADRSDVVRLMTAMSDLPPKADITECDWNVR